MKSISRWTVFVVTSSSAASTLALGQLPLWSAWWIFIRRSNGGRAFGMAVGFDMRARVAEKTGESNEPQRAPSSGSPLDAHFANSQQSDSRLHLRDASSPVQNEHAEVGYEFARLHVAVRIVEGFEPDDVALADLVDEVGQDLVEAILADLDAIEVPDAFGAQRAAFLRGGVRQAGRLVGLYFGRRGVLGDGELFRSLARCGRTGHRIDDARRGVHGVGVRDANAAAAGRAFDFRAGVLRVG